MQYKLQRSTTVVPYWINTFQSYIVCQKFINCIQKKGKKSLAEKLFFKMLYALKKFLILQQDIKYERDPILILEKAIQNAQPIVQLKSEKKSGRTIQIPSEIPSYKQLRLSIQWILESANAYRLRGKGKFVSLKKKPSALAKKPFFERLALEILKTALGKGRAIDKKMDLHRRAFLQRAQLRYKWKSFKQKQNAKKS